VAEEQLVAGVNGGRLCTPSVKLAVVGRLCRAGAWATVRGEMLGLVGLCRRARGWIVASGAVVAMGSAAAGASARDPVIAYLDASRQLQLYDSQVGVAVSSPALTVKSSQNAFAVSFDGRYIVYIAKSDGLIHLFDRVGNAEIPLPGINIYSSGGQFPADLSVSDTGLVAFDDGGNVGVVVYNSATGTFVPTGLSTSGNSGPRDPALSGDGKFLATTCITGPGTTCPNPNLNSTHATLFLQNLVTHTDTGLSVIDPNAPAGGTDEEHPCIDATGNLVGADAVDPNTVTPPPNFQNDVYIFDRATGSDLTITGLNTPGKDTIHCVLSFGGAYAGVSDDNGVVRAYLVATGSQIPVPSTIIPPIWFTAPFIPPDPPTITTPANGVQLTQGQVVHASYSCQDPAGGMGITSCAGPVATGSPVVTSSLGTHSFTVTATEVNGLTTATTSIYTVVAQPQPPLITQARQARRIWRERKSRKPGPRVGTTFFFTLNEPANVRFAFGRHVGGRKVRVKCVAQTHKNRRARRCGLTVPRGTLSFRGHRGKNRFPFRGAISRSKKLKPGTYTLTITATNASGQHSKPRSLIFTIVK
jgi:hypothetical protein